MTGEVVLASHMNTDVRDNLLTLATWTDYVPTWTAVTTNPALGNGALAGRWLKAGKLLVVSIKLTVGSTTTFGTGSWLFTYPEAVPVPASALLGSGMAYDASGNAVHGGITVEQYDATRMRAWPSGATTEGVRASAPMIWAVGDVLRLSQVLEGA